MKKVFCIFLLISSVTVVAQQKPQHTQYIMNNFILNPAIAGIENYTDIKLSYRNQWTGLDGAPTTMYGSFHSPINKKDDRQTATSFNMNGVNPRGKQYWMDDEVSPSHSGIGVIAMNDKAGYLSRSSVLAAYAYHKPLNVKTALSLGFQAGISSVSLDRTKIVWGSLDPTDPAIGYANGDLKKVQPELGAGVWLYSANYFIGASVINIIPGKNRYAAGNKYGSNFAPHFTGSAGYRFQLNDEVSVLPSTTAIWLNPDPIQIHGNVKMMYQDLMWLGASYRYSDVLGGFSAMAGINVGNTMNISYAYDLSTNSRLRTYSKNTHEILIGFLLGNKYGDSCPRNIW